MTTEQEQSTTEDRPDKATSSTTDPPIPTGDRPSASFAVSGPDSPATDDSNDSGPYIDDIAPRRTRAFGDLSENFEYKCAKQEKNRNDARVRYLQRMIKTAHVIDDTSAADAAGLDFEARHDVVQGFGKRVKRFLAGLFLDDVKSIVHDLLSNTLFAVEHHAVDELRHQNAVVHRIRQNFSFGNVTSSGHYTSLLH